MPRGAIPRPRLRTGRAYRLSAARCGNRSRTVRCPENRRRRALSDGRAGRRRIAPARSVCSSAMCRTAGPYSPSPACGSTDRGCPRGRSNCRRSGRSASRRTGKPPYRRTNFRSLCPDASGPTVRETPRLRFFLFAMDYKSFKGSFRETGGGNCRRESSAAHPCEA